MGFTQGVTRTLVVLKSGNTKTGPVALATYRTQTSCPTDCALMGSGCYAENNGFGGSPSPFGHAGRGQEGLEQLRERVAKVKPGQVIRLNVAGDYLLADGTPDHEYIEVTNTIPEGVTVISYTHAWRRLQPSWFRDHVRPNASCDTLADVPVAAAAGWATVIVDGDGSLADTTIDGRRFVACPYETNGRQCIDCKLCSRTNRPSAVVFTAHGSRRKKASMALAERRGDTEVS